MVVWSTMSLYVGADSSCMHQPPLANVSCPDATKPATVLRVAAVCVDHHRQKYAISTYVNRRAGSAASATITESNTSLTLAA